MQAQEDKVYKADDPGVVVPKLTQSVQPGYTDDAQARRITGTVTISFDIDREGKTRNVKIVAGLDPGLDRNAITAVSVWLFEPATKDGQTISFHAQTNINFSLQ